MLVFELFSRTRKLGTRNCGWTVFSFQLSSFDFPPQVFSFVLFSLKSSARTLGSFSRPVRFNSLFRLFNLNSGCLKHTENLRIWSKTKPTPSTSNKLLKTSPSATMILFFRKLLYCTKVSLFNFLIICNRMDVKKSPKDPFYIFRHHATYRRLQKKFKKTFFFSQFLVVFWHHDTVQNSHVSFLSPKGPLPCFDILQHEGYHKSQMILLSEQGARAGSVIWVIRKCFQTFL